MSQKLGERIQKAPQSFSVGIAFWGGYTIDQQKLLGELEKRCKEGGLTNKQRIFWANQRLLCCRS
jgi:hypothetical protein